MNLRPRRREDPEVNLIPMIDVVLVLVIFLMATAHFRQESVLEIRLPQASGLSQPIVAQPVLEIQIDAVGRYAVNGVLLPHPGAAALKAQLTYQMGGRQLPIVVRADARTPHQAVVTVLEVTSQLGMHHLTVATEQAPLGAPVVLP